MKRIKQTWAVSLLALLSLFASQPLLAEQPVNKPRVIVTCDPELDDLNSLIRLLLFSTDFRIEGLIYTSSQFPLERGWQRHLVVCAGQGV